MTLELKYVERESTFKGQNFGYSFLIIIGLWDLFPTVKCGVRSSQHFFQMQEASLCLRKKFFPSVFLILNKTLNVSPFFPYTHHCHLAFFAIPFVGKKKKRVRPYLQNSPLLIQLFKPLS